MTSENGRLQTLAPPGCHLSDLY